jgi:plasmid stability protein
MPTSDAKMPSVRTTIRIDDELYREIKERAARSGRSVGAVLEDAVRIGLKPRQISAPGHRFAVRASGTGGLVGGVDLASNAAVREALDDQVPLDALR